MKSRWRSGESSSIGCGRRRAISALSRTWISARPRRGAGGTRRPGESAALTAFALAIIATGGVPAYIDMVGFKPDLAFAHWSAERVAASAKTVRQIAPTAGSYLSESSYFNGDWKHAYWGENYPRLSGVKARYDPAGLFFVHHGVGSDGWDANGFERVG